MRKILLGMLWAAPALLVGGLAWSDYLATPGGPSTVFAFTCSATKICPASVLINSANTEIATAGAPLRVDPTGTTTQPVSGTVAATQSGAWTVNPTTAANWSLGATAAAVPANATYIGINTGGNLVGWNGTVTAVQPTGTNLHVVCDSGCSGSGGTSSNFGSAFPAAGTAIGLTSGTNMVAWSATTTYGTAPAAIAVPAVNAFVTGAVGPSIAAAVPNNGSLVAGEARTTDRASATSGNLTAIVLDKAGKQVSLGYSIPELFVSGTASATTTGATTLIAAGAAGIKNYITSVQCGRDDAGTTAIRVTFSDTGTSILVLPNNGGGGGNNATFPVPLVTAAATAFTFTASTATTTVRCSAQGYQGA